MSRVKRISFWATAALVVIFFLMSSTDLIIKEDVEKVKKISVFVAAEESSYRDNFKRGIIEAASDSRVDVNYVTAPTGQQETRSRIDSDVQAIILLSEEPECEKHYMEEKADKIPIITVNTFGSISDAVADVSFDLQEAAEELAEEVKEHKSGTAEAVLLTGKNSISVKVSETLSRVFEEAGIKAGCMELSWSNVQKCRREMEDPVFIGCWITQTEQAMEYLDGEMLYGVGYSNKILKGIREGKVTGTAAFSMYSAGIHAMRQAVSAMEQETGDIRIPCRMITDENIEEEQEFLIPVH